MTTAIRQELSTLTFEELEALKCKLGIKVYNEAMFGTKESAPHDNKKGRKAELFKRTNKNRPREISTKRRDPASKTKKGLPTKTSKDPRFESSCGDMNETLWKTNYAFLDDVQKQEREYLEQELKKESDDNKKFQMKHQIQRLKNKERSTTANQKEAEKIKQEKMENKKRMAEGKKPFYMKKSTKKLVELSEKYDELKASGKLEKYLKKKRQKNATRDRKSVNLQQRSE